MVSRLGRNFFIYMAIAIVGLTLPFMLQQDDHALSIVIIIMMLSVSGLGVRLLQTTGLWNVGQVAFMTIGMYVSALLSLRLNVVPFWGTMPISALFTGAVSLGIGYAALRLKGFYFSILTLALVGVVRQALLIRHDLTNALQGLWQVPPPAPLHIAGTTLTFESHLAMYYLMLVLLTIALIVMYRIDKSRLGLVFRAISDSDTLALSTGTSVLKLKLIAFVVSSVFAGMVGSFSTHYHNMAHPDHYLLMDSIYIVVNVIFGGVGSVFGTVLGTGVLYTTFEVLRGVEGLRLLAYGCVLLVVIRLLPGGLLSIPQVIRQKKSEVGSISGITK
ncbi:branched-chain amino acid ABC transporter permease [Chloroflexota bacterium]